MSMPSISAFGTVAPGTRQPTAPPPQIARDQLSYTSGINSASPSFAQGNAEQAKESNKTELDLRGCIYRALIDVDAPDLLKYPVLQKINLSNNELTQFPKCSQGIKEIDFSYNKLGEYKNVELNNLKYEAFYQSLPEELGFSQLPELEVLCIDHNGLVVFPDIKQSAKLKYFSCSHNYYLGREPDFSPHPALEHIDLNHCRLNQPVDVLKNPNLKYFNISDNQQFHWTDFSNCAELTYLNYGNNRLGSLNGIPLNLSRAAKLEELHLHGNGLYQGQMPDFLRLPQLRILTLHSNHLTELPNISKNAKLEEIDLSINGLKVRLDFSHLAQLKVLKLGINQLTECPFLLGLTNLKHVNLTNNKLEGALDFSTNTGLEVLVLNNNKLKVLPNISQNSELTNLSLEGNQLTESPDVSKNPKLEILNLRYNKLTSFHESIFDLPSTCTVYAEGNWFAPEVINQIKERLAKIRSEDPTRGPEISFDVDAHYLAPA